MTDGVTVDHPCCNEHDCKIPLRSVDDEFCPLHERLTLKCAVVACREDREAGFRTCRNPIHRQEEKSRKDRGRKKKPTRTAELTDEGSERKKVARKKGPDNKGVFSRKWTHNEQLMVRPCGIVIGRATFYQSESVTGVKVNTVVLWIRCA